MILVVTLAVGEVAVWSMKRQNEYQCRERCQLLIPRITSSPASLPFPHQLFASEQKALYTNCSFEDGWAIGHALNNYSSLG